METLTELHKRALKEGWAVPHFNFSSLTQLNGILDALRQTKAPALLGTSEGEQEFMGAQAAIYLIRSVREEEGLPVYLNADHHKSTQSVLEAFEAGYDSVHADFSKEDFKTNIKWTKQVVDAVKSKRAQVEVEGELGYFATDSSKIYKEVVDIPLDSYTQPKQAIEYVEATKVDRFAPVIGNLHGIAANKPKIKFDLVAELRKALPQVTFTLHGGSGISDGDMKKLVKAGFNNIHVSTELRVAYTGALRKELKQKPDEVAPYHYLDKAREATKKIVIEKLKLFGATEKV